MQENQSFFPNPRRPLASGRVDPFACYLYIIYTYKPLPYPSPTPRLARSFPSRRPYTAPRDTLPEHTVTRNHHFCPVQADAGCAKTVFTKCQPCFFTKSVRFGRTELSICRICAESRDLQSGHGFRACSFKTKRKKLNFHENMKVATLFCHQVGQIWSYRAVIFFRVANREIYNLSMVSGPALLQI